MSRIEEWWDNFWNGLWYPWREKKQLRELVDHYEKDLINDGKVINNLGARNLELSKELEESKKIILQAAENVKKERVDYEKKIKTLEVKNALLESRLKKTQKEA